MDIEHRFSEEDIAAMNNVKHSHLVQDDKHKKKNRNKHNKFGRTIKPDIYHKDADPYQEMWRQHND